MQKNRIELAGYLGAKPTVRYLPSGTPVANVRMAEGYRYTDRNNQTQEHTNWHNLSFYGELSTVAGSFDKGDNLFIEGSVEQRQFAPHPQPFFRLSFIVILLVARSERITI